MFIRRCYQRKMASRRLVLSLMLVICVCPILYIALTHNAYLYTVPADEQSKTDCNSHHHISDTVPADEQSKTDCNSHHHISAPAVKRVLLISYGRSGSTFVSYILKETPDTFFFFEPLRAVLTRSSRASHSIIMNYKDIGGAFLEPRERPVSNLSSYEQKAVKLMDQLFQCDIGTFPVNDYISKHFLLHGNVSKVARCLESMVNETYLNLSHYLQCLLDFWHDCRVASTRLFKVIRLPVRAAFALLRSHPDLRVVYLVRDPRAVLNSQSALFGKAPAPASFCRMMADDAAHMTLLLKTFPGRAVAVRYEDIARDPLNYTQRLYRALDLPLTPRVEMSIRKMTSASSHWGETKDPYSTFRSDSREAASVWRLKLTEVLFQDSMCGKAYGWLGYKAAGNLSVLRNLSVSLTGSAHRLPLL